MRIWPVFIDAAPAYLGSAGVSLLQIPIAESLLVSELLRRVETITFDAPTILAPIGAGSDYLRRMKDACPSVAVITTAQELTDVLSGAEVSDAILFVDPRCLPIDEAQFGSLMTASAVRPRIARHLVAFAPEAASTKEHVNVDGQGLVRSIHRYYEPATWPFITGVAASLVPVSSGILPVEPALTSLLELRQRLVSRGVPSHDVPIDGQAFDLTTEYGLLAAAERHVLKAVSIAHVSARTSAVLVGEGHAISPTARFLGPVLIQSNVRIDADATIVGPTLIGGGSHVSAGAVVAHALVGTHSLVPPRRVLHDRVWFTDAQDDVSDGDERREPSDPERLPRFRVAPHEKWAKAHDDGPDGRYLTWKRIVDAAAAGISLVVLSPFLLLVAALVRLSSRGPAFFSDEREGLGGKLFSCLKFRTMHTGANTLQRQLKRLDDLDGPHFKLTSDPRVTRVGRILRATNIDELPQLVNVLLGDMSLVGPRPSPFRENQICVPWREGRLSLRPGITGLWQVCRQDRASGDFHQWIEYDLLYVQHVSLLLDLRILAATVFSLGGKIPVPASWMVRTAPRPGRHAGQVAQRGSQPRRRSLAPAKSTAVLSE